ncbi:hypothetical protein GCM10028796_08140 [Ramlibacter monticola]|uniref:Uncharacterized protein n=1 Tax=Ramlibacter monticola TaxID=1926872 RepID=A0A937CRI3_9BURK|nr:hypothetical protein [Ramlibacter monticola]MBL0389674.1 hypothetical protein [Ramlibacter monticola]
MERIWGPVNGFYLAAYASPADDGEHFCSYAKVCWARPDSYWDADCAFKIFGGDQHPSLEDALAAVALEARNEASQLPAHARTLAEQRQRDRVPIPRLFATTFFRQRVAQRRARRMAHPVARARALLIS